jgi:hypothetical protein
MKTNRALIFTLVIGLLLLVSCGAPAPEGTPASMATEEVQATEAPSEVTEPTESVPPEPTAPSPSEATPLSPQPALPEQRYLTLEFPPEIRAGDSDVIRLTLEVDDLGNIKPTAQVGGNIVTGEVIEVPNLYETHHVVVEARFDIAGMEVRPMDLVSAPLAQGTPVTFYWSVRPQEIGLYRGTIWLYLRFVDKASGEESRKTVSAQLIEIEAVNFLGFSGQFARTTGVVGSIIGTVIGFPFLEEILKFLFKGRNKRTQ